MEAGLRRCRSSFDLKQCGTYYDGKYRSQWYRGTEEHMEWLRLSLDGPENLCVRVYTCDEQPDRGTSLENLDPVLEQTANDLLLYGVYGRYLCFTIKNPEKLKGFVLEFPGHSIADGLPTVMQSDETLRKFLGVYQSRFMDLNHEIDQFTTKLDTESLEVLPQLPRWLGASRWSQDETLFRKILPYAHELARLRGTYKGLNLLSEIVTGYPCKIVEGWQLDSMEESSKDSNWMYGEEGEGITVLVSQKASKIAAEQFRSLLRDFIPLGAPYQMIHMSDNALMDEHSYLDQNVTLADQTASELEDQGDIILE